MEPHSSAAEPSKKMFWTGWVLSILPILFMGVLGLILLLAKPGVIEEGMIKYGYPPGSGRVITWVEIACVILYAIPRTSVLGAILLTGYLGGAVSTHVRAGEPFYLPVIVAVIIWLGLYFRDPRLRALVPFRKQPDAATKEITTRSPPLSEGT
jgi:hypothetical protein